MGWGDEGEGFPVVLLHGIPTGPALWRHAVPRRRGVRAPTWEMVGYADGIPHGRGRDLSLARDLAPPLERIPGGRHFATPTSSRARSATRRGGRGAAVAAPWLARDAGGPVRRPRKSGGGGI